MITSKANDKVKMVTALVKDASERRSTGIFVVEGPRMASEVPAEMAVEVYVSESFLSKNEIPANLTGAEVTEVSDEVFAKMSDTKNPQGIMVLVKMPKVSISDLLSGKPLIILEGIQDPGNLGTMLRTGEAAGIGGIIADKNTVDAFNPKVIRSTMGAIFRVPLFVAGDLAEVVAEVKGAGYTVYAAHLKGEDIYEGELAGKSAFLIGNEGNGLSDEISALSDKLIKIPMSGKVESLNASICAGLLAYEWRRQHSK